MDVNMTIHRDPTGQDAANPDFSPVRAVQEQGISARRRPPKFYGGLRGLNNAVPGPLWPAFGEEHQTRFYLHFKTVGSIDLGLIFNTVY
jgi:hypothetical protein